LVEGVEDPFNLGQIIRTAYAAGCDGVLLNHKDFSYSEHTLLKSSAGAFDYLPIVLSHDLKVELEQLKQAQYKIYSALRNPDSINYTEADYSGNLVLAIGGELRGLSTKVIDATDIAIQIIYPKKVRVALNAVSACALLSFEVLRHRQA
ncbi:MAG: RNA methyltransferase, partial [Erysipelotrichaceae bacterium]